MESRATGMPPALRQAWQTRRAEEASALHAAPAGRVIARETTRLDISATRIRALVAHGQSPRYLLPDTLLDYIRSHHLYL
jgi:nicotinate-nucleotide adenylyltransferase